MANMAEYFAKRDSALPAPKFVYGQRVLAKMRDGATVLGMVIREYEGEILLHLDLPIVMNGEARFIVWAPIKNAVLRTSTDDTPEAL